MPQEGHAACVASLLNSVEADDCCNNDDSSQQVLRALSKSSSMQLACAMSVFLLLVACWSGASSFADAFECGAPGARCGAHLPEGVSCERGAGWCQPGYYCGYPLDRWTSAQYITCQPVPEDCGPAGKPCCPSNADMPHTDETDKLSRKPFCRDGNTCLFDYLDQSTTPALGGVRGEHHLALTVGVELALTAGSCKGSQACCPGPGQH